MSFGRCLPVVALLFSGVGGCVHVVAASSRAPAQGAADDAFARLQVKAAAERQVEAHAPIDAPPPPGIDPAILSPRGDDDTRPFFSLPDVVERLGAPKVASNDAAELTDAPQSLSPEQRLEAERLYVQGRQAALEGRHFIAVEALQRAMEINPDSPSVLRHLARGYAAVGNQPRAIVIYRKLAAIDPGDPEAAFTLALHEVNRSRFDEAAAAVCRVRAAGREFDHDPAAGVIADWILAMSLRRLGYDRAMIEAARRALGGINDFSSPTGYVSQLNALEQQRTELWRTIGDARCRLGEYDDALSAYRMAAGGGEQARPEERADLLPRVLYAHMRAGRPHTSQELFVRHVAERSGTTSGGIVRLGEWLNAASPSAILFGEALRDVAARRPDDAGLVRITAALLPIDEGAPVLRAYVEAHPGDRVALRQLLGWLNDRAPGEAAVLATEFVADDSLDAFAVADELFHVAGASPEMLSTMRQLNSASGAFLLARLQLNAGAAGPAWSALRHGLEAAPDDHALLIQRMEVAGALRDWGLVESSVDAAAALGDDVDALIAASRAWTAIDRTDRAVAVARRAVDAAPEDASAWVVLAEHLAADSSTAREAADAASRALAIDPTLDAAYNVLLQLHDDGGPLASLQDVRAVARRLLETNPRSPLLARLIADDFIARGQYDQAVERLMTAYVREPWREDILRAIVAARIDRGEPDDAEAWLRAKLRDRPHDPALWRELVRALVVQRTPDAAIDRLRARLGEHPDDVIAPPLLEVALRAVGETEEAAKLAEQRLLSRPECLRRSIDLASLYLSAGRTEDATAQLRPLIDRMDELPRGAVSDLVSLVGGMGADDGAARLQLSIVERFLESHPEAPLSVYGGALVATAQLEGVDRQFRAYLDDALLRSSNARGPSPRDAAEWRGVAQMLVDRGHPRAAAIVLIGRLSADDAPLDAQARAVLAQGAQACAVAAGDLDAALDVLDRLREHPDALRMVGAGGDANDPLANAHYSLGLLCTLLGRDDFADRLLERAIEKAPDFAMAMNNLVYHRIEEGRHDQATVDMIERAASLRPDNPSILDTLGWLRYKQGRFGTPDAAPGDDDALGLIRRAFERTRETGGSPNPELLDHLGDALWRVGEWEQAVEHWRQAANLAADPAYRRQDVEGYRRFLRLNWGVDIADPEAMYDRLNGRILSSAKDKIASVEAGEAPTVSPTFEELRSIASDLERD